MSQPTDSPHAELVAAIKTAVREEVDEALRRVQTAPADLRPLTTQELIALLGIKHTLFNDLRRRGVFRRLELKQPIGNRLYSRVLVTNFLAGESLSQFGRKAS